MTREDWEELSRSEMIERLMEYQEMKRYSSFDLHEFAEWCSENYNKTDSGWWKKKMIKPAPDLYTTSQLQIMWKIETGRRQLEEKYTRGDFMRDIQESKQIYLTSGYDLSKTGRRPKAMSYTLGDFDIWYQKCEHCGYDTGKSTKLEDPRCWRCGRPIKRDYSVRALKKEY